MASADQFCANCGSPVMVAEYPPLHSHLGNYSDTTSESKHSLEPIRQTKTTQEVMISSEFRDQPTDFSIFHLPVRNRMAERIIADYATGHAIGDVAIGLLGTFIPGMGAAALISAIVAQAPLVYQPMSRKLAGVYTTPPDKITDGIVSETASLGAGLDIAAQFAGEFFGMIAGEILQEAGIGVAISFIPIIGGIAAAGLDATIAATLTWRVGTMVAMYYQYGGRWIVNQKETYHRAARMVDGFSPRVENRVNLDDLPERNAELLDHQLKTLCMFIRIMGPHLTPELIREALAKYGAPISLIDQALHQFAQRATA